MIHKGYFPLEILILETGEKRIIQDEYSFPKNVAFKVLRLKVRSANDNIQT